MDGFMFFKRRNLTPTIIMIAATFFTPYALLAAPPHGPGRILFVGKTANGQTSVWLSATTRGMFEVQARNQVVDEWSAAQSGLHVTFSPMVSSGSGDPHSLYQIINGGLVFRDKANQQGGITFPPFPGGLPPGEVTPPIALPPIGPSHPIVNPSPGVPTHPIVVPPGATTPPSQSSDATAPDEDTAGFTDTAPLTPGRQFAWQPRWNVWVDARYFDLVDNRFGMDLTGDATNLTVGADRQVNNDLVIGAMVARNTGQSSSFDSAWQNNARGFTFGPYFGYRFLPNWTLDGTVGYGDLQNDNNISVLNSNYTTHVFTTSFIATGQYNVGVWQLRPKPAIYYNYFHSSSYNMNATMNGTAFAVPITADNFSYGFAQLALEASRTFSLAHGNVATAPFAELGLDYAFARPNSGNVLTSDLTMHSTSPWSGLVRVGARTLITTSVFVEASASYLSLGQPQLNVWEGRLFLSWAL